MSKDSGISFSKIKKRLGLSGAIIVILAVLACELPIVLALFGIVGMGSVFSDLSIDISTAIFSGLVGLVIFVFLLNVLFTRRTVRKERS